MIERGDDRRSVVDVDGDQVEPLSLCDLLRGGERALIAVGGDDERAPRRERG